LLGRGERGRGEQGQERLNRKILEKGGKLKRCFGGSVGLQRDSAGISKTVFGGRIVKKRGGEDIEGREGGKMSEK